MTIIMMTNQMVIGMFTLTHSLKLMEIMLVIVLKRDTMLDDSDPTAVQLKHVPYEIKTHTDFSIAPHEGQVPLSIFRGGDAKYLSFPTNLCGPRRVSNSESDVNVHYSDICKYELCSVDRRETIYIPNLFFKLKKLQMKQILDKVTLTICRYKTKGKKLEVKNIFDDSERKQFISLDEGYYTFRKI